MYINICLFSILGECDFEKGYCSWTNVHNGKGDDFDWTIWHGTTPSVNTGPTYDHTLRNARGNLIGFYRSCFIAFFNINKPET